ncbi:zinc finger protein 510-like [Mercenaria mercenaria]|uniref:zinc finger protein 510-like n=1 Tax=Mercenaria mercenaria TaxID=6596 RepID=UPI00234E97B3|nr:zinc finger protein 510-like [Mercenaria mercenaria]
MDSNNSETKDLDNNVMDLKDIQAAFNEHLIRLQHFKFYSCFYFFKAKDARIEDTEAGDQSIIFTSENRNNAWVQMENGDKKARCFSMYRCNECRTFKLRKREIIRHYDSMHGGRLNIHCSTCSAVFPSKVLLRIHEKRVHNFQPNQTLKCQLCHKTFGNLAALRKHERRHTGNLPYECATCGKKFLNRYSLVFHMESHSSKRLECRKCGTKFVHQKSYDQHQRAMCMGHRKRIAARKLQLPAMNPKPLARKSFICKYCSREYNFTRTIEIHIQQNHPEYEGAISNAYTVQEIDEVNQNGENSVPDIAINVQKKSAGGGIEADIDKADGNEMSDIDIKTTSVKLEQDSNDDSNGLVSSIKCENGEADISSNKGIKQLDADNYTNYLVRNFLLTDSVENTPSGFIKMEVDEH